MAVASVSRQRSRDHEQPSPDHVFGYIRQVSGRAQIGLVVLSAVVFPLTMVPLELQRHIVDDAIGGGDLRTLLLLCGLYLGVVLIQGGLKYALQLFRGRVSENVIRRMRRRIASVAADDARRAGPDRYTEGEVVPMAAAEVERVGGFVGASFSEPVLQAGILLSVLGYMVVVEPKVALVSLAVFLPQVIIVPLVQRVLNRRAQRIVTALRDLGERIVEHDRHLGEPGGRDDIDRIYDNRMSYYRLKFLLKFLGNLFNHLGPLSVLLVGGYYTLQGETTVGTVVAFISGFERMADPARQLLAYYRLASESQVKYRLLADRVTL